MSDRHRVSIAPKSFDLEERDSLRAALRGLLLHFGVADIDPEDKSPEDIEAEKAARAALDPKP